MAFWHNLKIIRERMSANPPEGQMPLVTVHLHSGDSFAPDVVSPDGPWLWFETVGSGKTPKRVVAAQEGSIAKVEIGFVPATEKEPVGFTVRESPTDTE
jgi:hypothetical protein